VDIRPHSVPAVIAVLIGNAFEWFDFVIFGYFAVAIAGQFFPADRQDSAILMSLAVFGAAFVTRPIGAIAFGHYGDRHGRKGALTLSILLMMVGTALIAAAPSRNVWGSFGACFILTGRLAQGFSAGGEFGSATAWLAEQTEASRGFFASLQFASQALTVVLATSSGALLTYALTTEALNAWGWRIPFIFGLLIGPIALYIRRRVAESGEFQSASPQRFPLREMLGRFKASLLTGVGLVTAATVTIYTLLFTPTFAVQYLHLPLHDGFVASLITGLVQVVLIPAVGALSDKSRRLPIAGFAICAILVTALPLLALLTRAPTFAHLLLFQVWIGAQLAIYLGTLSAILTELFPVRVRTTGLSIAYATSVTVFGGFAPFINAFLIEVTKSNLAPGCYLTFAAFLSLAALIAARKAGIR
jgi:MHS family proline/betaine transporter-like MFS transporter